MYMGFVNPRMLIPRDMFVFFAGCLSQFLHMIKICIFLLLPHDSILSEIVPKEFAEKVLS